MSTGLGDLCFHYKGERRLVLSNKNRTQGTEPPIPIPIPIPDLPGIGGGGPTPDLPGIGGPVVHPHPHPRFARIGDAVQLSTIEYCKGVELRLPQCLTLIVNCHQSSLIL